MIPQAASSDNQNLNTATLCKVGQDTVQEIVYRTIEIFKELKIIQVRLHMFTIAIK